MVPVLKKQAIGVCEVDNSHGVYLSSIMCMCKVRLSTVAEEEGLIAEEQGGF